MPKPFDTVEERQAFFALTGLSIEEGSFVDKGDNPEAHILLVKAYKDLDEGDRAKLTPATREFLENAPARKTWLDRAKGFFGLVQKEDMGPKTTAQILAEDEFRRKFFDLRMAFTESVGSILQMPVAMSEERSAMAEMMNQTVAEFAEKAGELTGELGKRDPSAAGELAGILDALARSVSKGGDANRGPFAQAMEDLEHFEFPAKTAPATEDNVPAEKTNPTLSDLVAKIGSEDDQKAMNDAIDAKVKAAVDEALKAAEGAEPTGDDPAKKAAELGAQLPPEFQAQFSELLTTVKSQTEKLSSLEEAQTAQTYLTKAQSIAADAGLDLAETADSLRKAYEVSTEYGAQLEKQLRALAEQVKLTKTLGNAGAFPVEKNTGEEKLEKLARDIAKRDGVSFEEAYDKAMDEDPEAAREAVPALGPYA